MIWQQQRGTSCSWWWVFCPWMSPRALHLFSNLVQSLCDELCGRVAQFCTWVQIIMIIIPFVLVCVAVRGWQLRSVCFTLGLRLLQVPPQTCFLCLLYPAGECNYVLLIGKNVVSCFSPSHANRQPIGIDPQSTWRTLRSSTQDENGRCVFRFMLKYFSTFHAFVRG